MYLKSMQETSSSGSRSTSSFHSGLFSIRAHKSQSAFTTAAVARWITPFSGPIFLEQNKNSSIEWWHNTHLYTTLKLFKAINSKHAHSHKCFHESLADFQSFRILYPKDGSYALKTAVMISFWWNLSNIFMSL